MGEGPIYTCGNTIAGGAITRAGGTITPRKRPQSSESAITIELKNIETLNKTSMFFMVFLISPYVEEGQSI